MCLQRLFVWLLCFVGLVYMAEFMWSDLLLTLIAVALAVLLATGYPEPKRKPKKAK